MSNFSCLSPPIPSRGSNSDYASFLKQHSDRERFLHPEWEASVSNTRDCFYKAIGMQYSPSKIELVRRKSASEGNSASDAANLDGIPLLPSVAVDAAVNEIPGCWSVHEVAEFLKSHLKQMSTESISEFWATYGEAVSRVRAGAFLEILEDVRSFIEVWKVTKKQRLKHLLFLEFFKLRAQLFGVSPYSLVDILSLLDVSMFRSLYSQLSSLELRSLARSRTASSTAVFLLHEVLPLFIRDIPVSFLEKVSTCAFDLELTSDDISKLWNSDLNSEIPKKWRSRHPMHRWDDSFSKSQKQFMTGQAEYRDESEAVTIVYEAPWVAPSLAKVDQSSIAAPRRQSVGVPARALKMEGRRQSYKPSPNEPSDALCTVHDSADDGFMLSRGVLDAMREWTHEDQQPSMLPDQPIGDVLMDLLHSPPQPSTRVATPVKETKKRGFEPTPQSAKRAKRSPAKSVTPVRVARNNSDAVPATQEIGVSMISEFLLDSNVSTLPSQENQAQSNQSPMTVVKARKPPKSEERKTDRVERRRIRDEADYHTLNMI